jgi:hypothetical protein
MDLTGLGPGSAFSGRSLARFWDPATADKSTSADPVMADHVGADGKWQSLAIGDAVYIRRPQGREELFNILDDPVQAHDLASLASARPTLESIRTNLERLLTPSPAPERLDEVVGESPQREASEAPEAFYQHSSQPN